MAIVQSLTARSDQPVGDLSGGNLCYSSFTQKKMKNLILYGHPVDFLRLEPVNVWSGCTLGPQAVV